MTGLEVSPGHCGTAYYNGCIKCGGADGFEGGRQITLSAESGKLPLEVAARFVLEGQVGFQQLIVENTILSSM